MCVCLHVESRAAISGNLLHELSAGLSVCAGDVSPGQQTVH